MPSFESQKLKQGCLNYPSLTYQEVTSYLDNHWTKPTPGIIERINILIGSSQKDISSIRIAGTTGKSTTIYYLTKLLQTEGLTVGSFSSPHFNFYNERIAINGTIIPHDKFTHLANSIIDVVKTLDIAASSKDILLAIALLYFKNEGVDVAIFEQEEILNYDPTTIFPAKVLGITRIVLPRKELIEQAILSITTPTTPATFITSADQSKSTLQEIAQQAKKQASYWIMPIRKIAPLPYPYEQLHGRSAALAERIAQTYINQISTISQLKNSESLLRITKKQRGRPSILSKKNLNSGHKTIENFWKTTTVDLPHRFQKIDSKHYTLLLDTASNIDALKNLLLGIRLLNYKKPFKSISFLLSNHHEHICEQEFIKSVRYFFKKISSHLILCPIANTIGEQTGTPAHLEKFMTLAQHAKIKVTVYKNFKTAFDTTTKQLHDSQDLLVITGSQAIISEYWKLKKNKDI